MSQHEPFSLGAVSLIRRRPHPLLQPFVKMLWLTVGRAPGGWPDRVEPRMAREHVLPTGNMHVVFRLTDDPLRLFRDGDDREGRRVGFAVVGGARAGFYVREVAACTSSVGAQLRPGASLALFGIPAGDLAERHTPLDDLWGRQALSAREELLELRYPALRLDRFERLLLNRLRENVAPHPGVLQAARALAGGVRIARAVEDSGYSHRRFIELFQREVGLTPKRYARLQRFQRVLRACKAEARPALVELALATGYSDQSHFTREFSEFAGLSPEAYRALAPALSHHVRIR